MKITLQKGLIIAIGRLFSECFKFNFKLFEMRKMVHPLIPTNIVRTSQCVIILCRVCLLRRAMALARHSSPKIAPRRVKYCAPTDKNINNFLAWYFIWACIKDKQNSLEDPESSCIQESPYCWGFM